jgi:hypothetical protein
LNKIILLYNWQSKIWKTKPSIENRFGYNQSGFWKNIPLYNWQSNIWDTINQALKNRFAG